MFMFWVLLFSSTVQGLERKISYAKSPGCKELNLEIHYLRAEGPNDTLHYVWDFTTKPSIFLALTNLNDSIDVSCKDFQNGLPKSFRFSEKPKYEFFLIITKLIEFNDVNDTGILTTDSPKISYDTKKFSWTFLDVKEGDENRFVSVRLTGTNFNGSQSSVSGNITVELTAFGSENHDSELPRLLHSPNSTQCKIILDNFSSNSGFNENRYAIEFILVSSDENTSSSIIVTKKNLDDENSPGIFEMVDIITPKSQDQLFRGAFLQWRPVLYTTSVPSIGNSSETVVYKLTKVLGPEEVLLNSLPYKYYGEDLNSVLVEQTVVSLGMTQDGFYKKTNFTSWTFLVNYGSPEEEQFSLLVILVMCIGLGLPALLILIGGSYMCARRIRRKKDELSLERLAVAFLLNNHSEPTSKTEKKDTNAEGFASKASLKKSVKQQKRFSSFHQNQALKTNLVSSNSIP